MEATTVTFVGDLTRLVLPAACILLGSLLIVFQAITTVATARAAKAEADLNLLKAQKAADDPAKKTELANAAAPDASGVMGALVTGLSTSAPLLAGGIVLYILAAVLLGSLSFNASAGTNDSSETSQSTPADDGN